VPSEGKGLINRELLGREKCGCYLQKHEMEERGAEHGFSPSKNQFKKSADADILFLDRKLAQDWSQDIENLLDCGRQRPGSIGNRPYLGTEASKKKIDSEATPFGTRRGIGLDLSCCKST